MQYHEYIANDNARREREQQLTNRYNQKPVENRVQNLWMVGVEKHTSHNITAVDVIKILIGLATAGGILILSILL
jgi:hypothetical protein